MLELYLFLNKLMPATALFPATELGPRRPFCGLENLGLDETDPGPILASLSSFSHNKRRVLSTTVNIIRHRFTFTARRCAKAMSC